MAANESVGLIPFYPFLYEELFEPLSEVVEDRYIASNEKIAFFQHEGAGILNFLLVQADTPDFSIIISADGKETTNSIKALYNLGLTFPLRNFFFVSRYDTANNIYVVVYDPLSPLSFSRYCHITAYNESAAAAKFTAVISAVKISEKLIAIASAEEEE